MFPCKISNFAAFALRFLFSMFKFLSFSKFMKRCHCSRFSFHFIFSSTPFCLLFLFLFFQKLVVTTRSRNLKRKTSLSESKIPSENGVFGTAEDRWDPQLRPDGWRNRTDPLSPATHHPLRSERIWQNGQKVKNK